MSTISSNVDLTTKYQRIAAEYAKLKAQIPVLKNAFFDEQAKSKRLTEEVQTRVAYMRKLESEIESLEFRNEQLLKRVEALQIEADEVHQIPSKEKKNSNYHQNVQNFTGDNDFDILKDELEIKIQENQFLHSKIEEITTSFENEKRALEQKCAEMEAHFSSSKTEQKMDTGDGSILELKKDVESQVDRVEIERNSTPNFPPIQENGNVNTADVEGTLHALLSDSIQKVHNIFKGIVNLLRLFEQRSTVYPKDMVLEPLSESTIVFGQNLLETCQLFEVVCSFTEKLCAQALEENNLIDVRAEVSKFSIVFSQAVKSCQAWYELFKASIETENRVSWCGPNLFSCNEEWCSKFLQFLELLITLSNSLHIDDGTAESCAEILAQISKLLSECSVLYSQKMFDENRLPTASKRLKCINDCIEKCLASTSRNLESFIVLLNLVLSTHSLRVYIASVFASQSEDHFSESTSAKYSPVNDSALNKDDKKNIDIANDLQDPMPQCRCNELESELRSARCRLIELEKERDRLLVETELLKMKLSGGRVETHVATPFSDSTSEKLQLVTSFYDRRLEELVVEIQYLHSRASYYQNECEALLQRAQLTEAEKNTLTKDLSVAKDKIAQLNDDLDTIQKGYEEQMRSLCEHMGELNAKIESQSETITSLKTNGIGGIKQGARKLLFK